MLVKIFKNKLLYDLELDAEYYGWNKAKHHYAKSFYKPSYVFSWLFHSYVMVVFFRAINRIWKYNHYYPEVLNSSVFGIGCYNLSTIDSTLFLPIVAWILNYLVMRSPDHPFLVNFKQRYGNVPKTNDGINERINRSQSIWTPNPIILAPIIGWFGIALPKAYLLAWGGYISTHLLLRMFLKLKQK